MAAAARVAAYLRDAHRPPAAAWLEKQARDRHGSIVAGNPAVHALLLAVLRSA